MTAAYDLHIGYPSPERWDKVADGSVLLYKMLGGTEVRPTITSEKFDWRTLGLAPRWVDEDTSGAVAAIEPNKYFNRGATEWERFIAGAQQRSEVALAVSMIGHPGSSVDSSVRSILGTADASVDLPGSEAGSVGGFRIPLAVAPSVANGLGRADRDLALRLVNARGSVTHWWTLHHNAIMIYPGAGGPGREVQPDGSLQPLLVSAVGEVVAAVWVSPDKQLRHYVIPWMPSWRTVMDWLVQHAIPEFVPSAVRRVHANLGEDPALQTEAEKSALAARDELDEQYRIQSAQLEQILRDARTAADEMRFNLLYGRSTSLESAVAATLTDAGMTVVPLDSDLKNTASADLLVSYQARRRLVEVKSESGNASEKLVGDARNHLDTWSSLRPDIAIEGVSLIINHQIRTYPADRSDQAYTRPEFVESLTMPVITTTALFDAWRHRDLDAIRTAVFGAAPQQRPGEPAVGPESQLAPAAPRSPTRTRRRWRWTRTRNR
ncbi:hypothetical protein [Mycolicibacterium sp.]|uniref:hypothetical protein n=1 Tax=Mycolicibacterium sp. TaxID=2320850 RepID=UPI0037C93B51